MQEKFFTTAEIAEYLRVSEKTVRNLCFDGQIEYVKVGVQLRISENSLNKFLNLSEEKEKKENE